MFQPTILTWGQIDFPLTCQIPASVALRPHRSASWMSASEGRTHPTSATPGCYKQHPPQAPSSTLITVPLCQEQVVRAEGCGKGEERHLGASGSVDIHYTRLNSHKPPIPQLNGKQHKDAPIYDPVCASYRTVAFLKLQVHKPGTRNRKSADYRFKFRSN